MELDPLRDYLLTKAGAYQDFPFGPDAMVFKVMKKMFALVAWGEDPLRITLKCDPDLALSLREVYESVRPGYYMNKKHWNTVTLDGTVPDDEIFAMIDDSYQLVVKTLRKADKEKLKNTQ
ncbi:MmcQ/YjbR family DNA-binding protein [Desulfococcaceae bacterium HSG8]|nr:MmcQ/YjbR family DNA-binding protein [Desulfococcaceae bacterium HSG8]